MRLQEYAGKGTLTGRYSNSLDSFAHTSAGQAAAAAFSQQAAPWKIWDNSRSFLLESSLCNIKIWGKAGEAQISFCEKKMLLKSDTRNFVPHLYFHCLRDQQQQQFARNALYCLIPEVCCTSRSTGTFPAQVHTAAGVKGLLDYNLEAT